VHTSIAGKFYAWQENLLWVGKCKAMSNARGVIWRGDELPRHRTYNFCAQA
jgi:hypothetical protein